MTFGDWAARWMAEASFKGAEVPCPDDRIDRLLTLWGEPIPGEWMRAAVDPRLTRHPQRCGRSHKGQARGEHALEADVLDDPQHRPATCLGATLVDGVSAVPLTRDAAGGRAGNVEADMLLLLDDARHLLVEAKVESNHAWFAVVENLRQLKLFKASTTAQAVFSARGTHQGSATAVTGVVLAPPAFYCAPGRRSIVVDDARTLIDRFEAVDAHVVLATWDPETRTIAELPRIDRAARA